MAYPQILGWNLVSVPSGPAFRSANLTMHDAVGQVISPFTQQSQTQIWSGADYWELDLSLPPMKRADAVKWIAWLAAMRGKANVFQYQDILGLHPQGSQSGTPLTDGTHLASAITLNTRGWTANAQGVLLTGDYITVGYRLHMVLQDVNADAAGKASTEVWPSLREAIADGVTVITQGTTGLFRLADNARSWSVNQAKIYTFSFKAVEAR